MTVADLLPLLPMPYADAAELGLVFGAGLAQRLTDVQAETPSQHYARPVPLPDGRFLLCGDLLSEVGPNGLYAQGFAKLDAGRFGEIQVIDWAEAVAMLPVVQMPA